MEDRQTDRQTEHSFFLEMIQAISNDIYDNAYELMKCHDKHDEDSPAWIASCRARDLALNLKREIETYKNENN